MKVLRPSSHITLGRQPRRSQRHRRAAGVRRQCCYSSISMPALVAAFASNVTVRSHPASTPRSRINESVKSAPPSVRSSDRRTVSACSTMISFESNKTLQTLFTVARSAVYAPRSTHRVSASAMSAMYPDPIRPLATSPEAVKWRGYRARTGKEKCDPGRRIAPGPVPDPVTLPWPRTFSAGARRGCATRRHTVDVKLGGVRRAGDVSGERQRRPSRSCTSPCHRRTHSAAPPRRPAWPLPCRARGCSAG